MSLSWTDLFHLSCKLLSWRTLYSQVLHSAIFSISFTMCGYRSIFISIIGNLWNRMNSFWINHLMLLLSSTLTSLWTSEWCISISRGSSISLLWTWFLVLFIHNLLWFCLLWLCLLEGWGKLNCSRRLMLILILILLIHT